MRVSDYSYNVASVIVYIAQAALLAIHNCQLQRFILFGFDVDETYKITKFICNSREFNTMCDL